MSGEGGIFSLRSASFSRIIQNQKDYDDLQKGGRTMKRMIAAGILFVCAFGMLGVGLGLLLSGMFAVFAKRK